MRSSLPRLLAPRSSSLARLLAPTLALFFSAACDSNESKKNSGPPTGFVMEVPASGQGVFLRGRREGDHVIVDVIAQGIDEKIHGAAFRLHWDPSKLAFLESAGSDAWSRDAIVLSKEGAPGELVVAWTEKGSAAGVNATKDTVLGSMTFAMKTTEGATLSFRPDRSTLRDEAGRSIRVEWRGGEVAAR